MPLEIGCPLPLHTKKRDTRAAQGIGVGTVAESAPRLLAEAAQEAKIRSRRGGDGVDRGLGCHFWQAVPKIGEAIGEPEPVVAALQVQCAERRSTIERLRFEKRDQLTGIATRHPELTRLLRPLAQHNHLDLKRLPRKVLAQQCQLLADLRLPTAQAHIPNNADLAWGNPLDLGAGRCVHDTEKQLRMWATRTGEALRQHRGAVREGSRDRHVLLGTIFQHGLRSQMIVEAGQRKRALAD